MQEPTTASPEPLSADLESVPVEQVEHEVGRLEDLLAARSRERRELASELAQTTRLLREALARLSEQNVSEQSVAQPESAITTPTARTTAVDLPAPAPAPTPAPASTSDTDEANKLRSARDQALARAIEAEAGRAELAFRLDEALGHLQTQADRRESTSAGELRAERTTSVGFDAFEVERAELVGALRGLRARLAELEELHGAVEARLLLREQTVLDAQLELRRQERVSVEDHERFELDTLQLRAEHNATAAQLAHARADHSKLRGSRDGLQARADEAERAFDQLALKLRRSEQAQRDAIEKLTAVRAELATQTAQNHALSAQLHEQEHSRGNEHDELRGLRAQLSELQALHDGVQATLAAHDDAAESHVENAHALRAQLAVAQVAALEERRAGEARVESLCTHLRGLRDVLSELPETLHGVASGAAPLSHGVTSVGGIDAPGDPGDMASTPGMANGSPDAAANELENKLRQTQLRIEELEAQLVGRGSARDSGVAALKGELVDVRASAARMADDLSRERSRRRKLAVTVRAMQAASESGESTGPWIDELLSMLNEGASLPPPSSSNS